MSIPRAVKITKNGKILKGTNNALEWFPELEQFFKNFDIAHMKIRVKGSKDYFAIVDE